jgi:hypothetical protein
VGLAEPVQLYRRPHPAAAVQVCVVCVFCAQAEMECKGGHARVVCVRHCRSAGCTQMLLLLLLLLLLCVCVCVAGLWCAA